MDGCKTATQIYSYTLYVIRADRGLDTSLFAAYAQNADTKGKASKRARKCVAFYRVILLRFAGLFHISRGCHPDFRGRTVNREFCLSNTANIASGYPLGTAHTHACGDGKNGNSIHQMWSHCVPFWEFDSMHFDLFCCRSVANRSIPRHSLTNEKRCGDYLLRMPSCRSHCCMLDVLIFFSNREMLIPHLWVHVCSRNSGNGWLGVSSAYSDPRFVDVVHLRPFLFFFAEKIARTSAGGRPFIYAVVAVCYQFQHCIVTHDLVFGPSRALNTISFLCIAIEWQSFSAPFSFRWP